MEYWLGVSLACISGVTSIALLVLGLPGTWLIWLTATVFAWWTHFAVVGPTAVVWLLMLAILGEFLEFWLGAAATAKGQGAWKITVGALLGGFLGGILGAPFFLGVGALLGTLIGTFVGAAAGAWAAGRTMLEAFTLGRAALRGRWWGFVAKAGTALMMAVTFLVAVLT